MSEPTPSMLPHERTGRRVGLVVFSLVVGALTANFTIQIIVRAYGLGRAPTSIQCTDGLRSLVAGLDQARQSAAASEGEQPALEAFRAALGPAWAEPFGVRDACRDNPERLRDFRLVQEVRYAEEHAVRYESRGVAEERRKLDTLRVQLGNVTGH